MNEVFQLIAEVGFPIAGALVMGAFIFIIIKIAFIIIIYTM